MKSSWNCRAAVALVALSSCSACSRAKNVAPDEDSIVEVEGTQEAGGSDERALPLRSAPPTPPSGASHEPASATSAQEKIDVALSRKALPGAEGLEKVRSLLLSRAKNEPVFFVRTPQDSPASKEIDYYRFRVRSSASPWSTLSELLNYFRHYPEKGNLTLLKEGYLYSEDPKVAYALVGLVGAHHLFDTERIWLQRGVTIMHARRINDRYVFEDGVQKGEPVRLLLLDRVGSGDLPQDPALHRDFRALRYELGFDRVTAEHITEDSLVVKLRYGPGLWIRTLLRAMGPRLTLEAEVVGEGESSQLERIRGELKDRLRLIRLLQEAMLVQVDEAPPFDEPRTEVGQQDGILRRAWRFAYERGRSTYHVYDDWYQVFDEQGRARVPQVCVDFLLDTFERASGTWWKPKGEEPGRSQGSIDFEKFKSRNTLRRARRFVEFSLENPEWFDVHSIPVDERIILGNKRLFFSYLANHAEDYRAGDMVFIRGKTPWDPHLEHTHSFFIYETDPISGIPIAIAGNASFPAIWSWETEARRTPRRTLRRRIRPTAKLLQQLARDGKQDLSPRLPTLSP